MDTASDVITESLFQENIKTRKELLPWWIKVFSWIFIVFGTIAPVGFVLGLLGYNFSLTIYGLITNDPLSVLGIFIILVFAFKGITAFCFLFQKDLAIIFGTIDAIAGIIICCIVMIYPFINPNGFIRLNFRLELLLLVPYLIRLGKIKGDWAKAVMPLAV